MDSGLENRGMSCTRGLTAPMQYLSGQAVDAEGTQRFFKKGIGLCSE